MLSHVDRNSDRLLLEARTLALQSSPPLSLPLSLLPPSLSAPPPPTPHPPPTTFFWELLSLLLTFYFIFKQH